MTAEAPKKDGPGRGRPAKPKDETASEKFHLVCLKEEIDLVKLSAKAAGFPSANAFIRSSIHQFRQGGKLNIPRKLQPLETDTTSKHFPLLLSTEERAAVTEAGRRNQSLFIRTAALALAFSTHKRTPEFEQAVKALADFRNAAQEEGKTAEATPKKADKAKTPKKGAE